ncbi:MAG: SpoVG family protein [Planctomycetales bacterium]
MEITEVRIKLMEDPHDRLQAFCSITFDSCFVVRDLKIIQGTKGPFVAMPSRKLSDRCGRCGNKNHLRAQHCNQCGCQLDPDRALRVDNGRAKLYADIAHPINCACREKIQSRVLEAFEVELVKAKQPGYVCTYDDYGDDDYDAEDYAAAQREATPPARFVRTDDGAHRIEPAASRAGGPHRHVALRQETAAARQAEHAVRGNAGDDDFAAGLH